MTVGEVGKVLADLGRCQTIDAVLCWVIDTDDGADVEWIIGRARERIEAITR